MIKQIKKGLEEPLKTTLLDPKFKLEIAEMPGGESIVYCFQCGKCTATCPVRRFEEAYKPREIIRATLLGLKDVVLSSDVIWLCGVCYSCTERCPQGVRITDVIRSIRNLAVKKGYIYSFFKIQGGMIAAFGRIYEDEDFINEQRIDLELKPLSEVDRKELSKLLSNTNVKKILSIEEE